MVKFKDIRKILKDGQYIIFATVKGIKQIPGFYVVGQNYQNKMFGDFTEEELDNLEVVSMESDIGDSGYGSLFSPDYYSYIGICLNI